MKHQQNKSRNWKEYYQKLNGTPPRPLLLKALEMMGEDLEEERLAVDLGSGVGQDSLALLERDWRVMAVDSDPNAFDMMLKNLPEKYFDRFIYFCGSFENAYWGSAHLINASYSLPFCPEEYRETVWRRIRVSLFPGGWFVGTFFGINDDWKTLDLKTKEEVEHMFRGFDIKYWLEEEKDMRTATSTDLKHWHIFHVIAQKAF